jgi:cytochrome P450
VLETETLSVARPLAPRRMPRTSGLPLVGSLPEIIIKSFDFLLEARETYGDLYRLNLGLTDVVVLNHPRQMQHVLVDHVANYRKGGPLWDAIRVLLGNGLVVSEGDFWLRQRRMLQPQFHRQRLAELTGLMVEAIDGALNSWTLPALGGTFNLAPAFNHLTMKVITRTLFGTGLSEPEMDEVSAALNYVVDYVLKAVVLNSLPAWLPAPGRRQYAAAIAQIDRSVYQIIAASRARRGPEHPLLAMLLDAVDAETGESMTDRQLRDEVTTLFLAGYETTSLTLSWALDFLVHRPAMFQRLEAEVQAVLGERRPTFADLPQLEYTRRVLHETLRMRPSAWQVMRTAVADDEIDGYPIPAGTNVLPLIYACHYHPEEWPHPQAFDPERFAPEAAAARHKLAWMPFGAGQRMCIGRDFALMEGQLALAMAVQRFRFAPAGDQPAAPQLAATLRPKDGVKVQLTPRQSTRH